ncbi:MAG: PaaI family thioesterase [Xylophilus ampelinus]
MTPHPARPPEDPALPETAPFADWIGLRTESAAGGRALLRLEPRGELLNRRAVVHGGVLATMLDSAMAHACRTVEGVRELGGTTDLHVQFLRPASGSLSARGWVEHAAGTLAFCRGEVRDAGGALVASGSASVRLRR